jgi:hypothetical protein
VTAIHAILILLIRLWAISALLNSFANAIQLAFLLADDVEGTLSATVYIIPLIWAVAGIVAWAAAPKLSRNLFNINGEANVSITVDAELLVTIGSFLIGAFVLVEHGPQLLIKLATWFFEGFWSGQDTPFSILKFLFRQVATEALIVTFALWLVLRPAKLSVIFSRLRTAGLSSQQDGESKGEEQ